MRRGPTMAGIEGVGKLTMIVGAVLLVLGGGLIAAGRFTALGRLPGDILMQRDNVTIYVPIVTLILLSILLNVILNVVLRLLNR